MIRPACFALFAATLALPSVLAQNVSLISVSSTGAQGNNTSTDSGMSADGRYVVFRSAANTLVPGDSNPVGYDVFVRDRQAGTTTLVSVSSNGVQSNGQCGDSTISADGRFVAFRSLADNLVIGDTNGKADVFVHDLLTAATTRVSLSSVGIEGNDACSGRVGISGDGRYVVFQSSSSNLVAGDSNDAPDVFVNDRLTGITTRVSVDSAGAQTGGGFNPAISDDGRFVSFESLASNLVQNDLNHVMDVFVHDMQTGVTDRVSVNSAGMQGRGSSGNSALSADGRFVAFRSNCAAFVPGGIPRVAGVFLHDRQTGVTTRVSVSSGGAVADINAEGEVALASNISISGDGRFVAFVSRATNLVAGDTNQFQDVFVHDTQTGSTVRVNVAAGGAQGPTGSTFSCALSANGRLITFTTRDALVAGDTNDQLDVYASDNPLLAVGTPLCAGDGSGTACPCANFGAFGHGCANSVDAQGAVLSGNGSISVAHDSLVLTATGLPDSTGLYFQSTGQMGTGLPFGDGVNCVAGIVRRLGAVAATGHESQFPASGTPISVVGSVQAGDVRYYQLWYRDANATFCTSSRFNLTNALGIQWAP